MANLPGRPPPQPMERCGQANEKREWPRRREAGHRLNLETHVPPGLSAFPPSDQVERGDREKANRPYDGPVVDVGRRKVSEGACRSKAQSE